MVCHDGMSLLIMSKGIRFMFCLNVCTLYGVCKLDWYNMRRRLNAVSMSINYGNREVEEQERT